MSRESQRMKICKFRQKMTQEYLSDASEDSFVSATGDFVSYDVANEDEAVQHVLQVAEEKEAEEEEEEEQMLLSRFSGEVYVRQWCVGIRCEVFF